jgi:hypothetical protein
MHLPMSDALKKPDHSGFFNGLQSTPEEHHQPVTAPLLAVDAKVAYLASTPRV